MTSVITVLLHVLEIPKRNFDPVFRVAMVATVLKPLDAVFHSALRFIMGDRFSIHHCTLYEKVGWPSLMSCRSMHSTLFCL